MKKITSKEDIKFRVNGALLLNINEVGVVVTDEVAKFVSERLGMNVTVTDAVADDVVEGDTDGVDYSKMTVTQLRDELEKLGLSTEGNKATLIERLNGTEVADETEEVTE